MYSDPRVSDHLQGLELRVIELTRKLERARRFGLWGRGARLQRLRQRLFAEMALISLHPTRRRPPTVHARQVQPGRPAA